MGGCHAKPLTHEGDRSPPPAAPATPPPGSSAPATPASKKHWTSSPFFPFSTPSPSPAHHLFSSAASPRTRNTPSKSPAPAGSAPTTPARRLLRLPFPPPSPAKHIRQALARRHGPSRPAIPEEGGDGDSGRGLDKGFGFNKGFAAKYDMGDEVGRGHFGYTCAARIRKGSRKGDAVAVKVIPKAKMTTSIAIEDVRREVKILKALAGHKNLVQFYDAYEDNENVYIVMELCEGGELLDRILSRTWTGNYSRFTNRKGSSSKGGDRNHALTAARGRGGTEVRGKAGGTEAVKTGAKPAASMLQQGAAPRRVLFFSHVRAASSLSRGGEVTLDLFRF